MSRLRILPGRDRQGTLVEPLGVHSCLRHTLTVVVCVVGDDVTAPPAEQHVLHYGGVLFSRGCAGVECVGDATMLADARALRKPSSEGRTFFERPESRPERSIDRVRLRSEHAVGRVHMAHPAPEAEDVSLLYFPQRPMTLRTA